MYYYIDKNNNQAGPIPISELSKKGVTGDTYVWREGMSDWMQAKYIPELRSVLLSRSVSSFYRRPIPVTHGDSVSINPTDSQNTKNTSSKLNKLKIVLVVSVSLLLLLLIFYILY